MAFVRPTLTKLISRAQSDIETRLEGASALLRGCVEWVLARVVAGAAHGLHGHLVWLSKQIIPDTAESEFMTRWADIWGLERTAAVAVNLQVAITGVNTSVCPAGTEWQSADGAYIYTQDASATISGGTATIAITEKAPINGADANLAVNDIVTLISPVAGIDSNGTVTAVVTTGVDEESDEDLLERLLLRLQSPPKGGGPGDYEQWALEVSGVTRAWQISNADGLGTVALYFVMDDKVGTIIPDAGEIATVQAYLDTKAPVTADVTAYAPTATTLNITASVTPNTASVKAAVEAEVEDLLLREGTAEGFTLYWSWLNEAFSIAEGETDHTITIPAASVVYTVGQIPVLGTITWT